LRIRLGRQVEGRIDPLDHGHHPGDFVGAQGRPVAEEHGPGGPRRDPRQVGYFGQVEIGRESHGNIGLQSGAAARPKDQPICDS
jgi:hypothetical protein